MKKISLLCMMIIVLCFSTRPILATENSSSDDLERTRENEYPLYLCPIGELPLDESISFLADTNILVPNTFDSKEIAAAFVNDTVNAFLSEGIDVSPYSFTYLADFYNSICVATREHYEEIGVNSLTDTRYTLQDSVLLYWNTNCQNYNCYSYSLNITSQAHNPGDISGAATYSQLISALQNGDVDALAGYVKADLISMGYCARVQSWMPTLSGLASNEQVICVRIGSNSSISDYHFMRYDKANQYWSHKPSTTAVLRYLYNPSNITSWSNERYINGVSYSPTIYYTTSIRYIVYKTTHQYSVADYDSTYHKYTCSVCGNSYFEHHIENALHTACSVCGRPVPFSRGQKDDCPLMKE